MSPPRLAIRSRRPTAEMPFGRGVFESGTVVRFRRSGAPFCVAWTRRGLLLGMVMRPVSVRTPASSAARNTPPRSRRPPTAEGLGPRGNSSGLDLVTLSGLHAHGGCPVDSVSVRSTRSHQTGRSGLRAGPSAITASMEPSGTVALPSFTRESGALETSSTRATIHRVMLHPPRRSGLSSSSRPGRDAGWVEKRTSGLPTRSGAELMNVRTRASVEAGESDF